MTPGAESTRSRCGAFAAAVVLLIAALSLLLYWPALSGEFLDWDDTTNFVRNAELRGGTSTWGWAWRANTLGVYQPVSWLIIGAVNGGGMPSAYRVHLAAVVTHAINAMLCAVLFVSLLDAARPQRPDESGRARWLAAGLAAALYAVHPLRAETVAWASALPYELAAMFSVACVIAYLNASSRGGAGRWAWYALSIMLSAAAMLSKSAAVALPAVLIVLDIYPLQRLVRASRSARTALVEKAPFVLIAAMATAGAMWASSSAERPVGEPAAPGRAAQIAYGLGFALTRTIAPLDLSAYYPRPVEINPLDMRFVLAAAVVIGATIAAIFARRRAPALTAAWVVYLLVLLPAVGLVSHGHQLTADRYATLSTIGFFAAMAAGLWRVRRSAYVGAATCVGVISLISLAAMARARTDDWRDSATLWSRVAARHPDSYFARKSLAGVHAAAGDTSAAERELRTALRLNPDFGLTHYDLGVLLLDRGDVAGAVAAFERAADLLPTFKAAHYNLGVALAASGRLDESLAALRRAERLSPADMAVLNNIGAVLIELGRPNEAAEALARAMSRAPENADLWYNLGRAHSAIGDAAEARRAFERALDVDTGHGDAADAVARMAIDRGDWRLAIEILQTAYAKSPDHEGVAITLAWSLLNVPHADLRDVQSAAEIADRMLPRDATGSAPAQQILEAALRAGATLPVED